MDTITDAYFRCEQLYADLKRIADADPEQEVQGIAAPVLVAALRAAEVADVLRT